MSERLVTPALLGDWPLPALPTQSDKETRGRVLVVGGGAEMPGAVILAALGALRAGAGKLQVAAAAPMGPVLGAALPEARIVGVPGTTDGDLTERSGEALFGLASRADAVVIGPGMPDETIAADLAARLVAAPEPATFVLDAAALQGLAAHAARLAPAAGRVVLTPHTGEMAALLGVARDTVEADPPAFARRAARAFGAVVALKGATTHVVSPDGLAWRYEDGPVGLATSGSGDVLAGVIGGLLARGAPPAQAAVWGVALHGEAGRLLSEEVGPLGFLAREIPPAIPRVMTSLCGPA